MILNCYRIYCETEAAYVEAWGTSEPSQCPNDSGHTIDVDSIAITMQVDPDRHAKIDPDRDFSQKVKLQFHRNGQAYRSEGVGMKLNASSPGRVTDYTPRNHSTTLTQDAASGQNQLHVESVKNFCLYQMVTIDRGGVVETGYVSGIDKTNNTLTLSANLDDSHATGVAVDADQVEVYKDGDSTVIDYWILGQNTDSALAGADFQSGTAMVDETVQWANGDLVNAEIRVPYDQKTFQARGSTVLGGTFCDRVPLVKSSQQLPNNSEESASAIDPNYLLRIEFTPGEDTPTEKYAAFRLETWRT